MRLEEALNKAILKTRRIIAFPIAYIKSKKLLEKIDGYRSDDTDIVLVLLKGIGDSAYGLSFVECLKEKYNAKTIIVIGNKKLSSFIMSYPNVDKLIPYDVSKGEYKKFKAYMDCERIKRINGYERIFNTDPFHVFSTGKMQERSAISLLREQVFHLSRESKITYPPVSDLQVVSIQNFDKIASKTIVLNPYSNSIKNIEMEAFENMVGMLKAKGYIVFTNLIEGQEPIKGTCELHCSVEELTEIVRRSAGIVSVRSGVLDLVINSGTSIFVLYTNCTSKFKEIYSLGAWNGKSHIIEVDYDNISKQDLMKNFCLWIEGLENDQK